MVVQTQSFSHAGGAVEGDFHHAEMACCMVLPPTEIWFQMPLIGRGTWAALVEAKLLLK